MSQTKNCGGCGQDLPLSEFSSNQSHRDGLQTQCRSCHRDYVSQWRRAKSIGERLLSYARYRAKTRGWPEPTVTPEYIESRIPLDGLCPVFRVPMLLTLRDNRASHDSASIDAVVPERFYTPGNIAIMSLKANSMKSNATLEECERLCQLIRGISHGQEV